MLGDGGGREEGKEEWREASTWSSRARLFLKLKVPLESAPRDST